MSITKLFIEEINFNVEHENGQHYIQLKDDGKDIGFANLEEFYGYNWDIKDIMDQDEFDKYFSDIEYISLRHMEINREFRGKGYANKLMKKVIEFCKKEGFSDIHLNASPMDSFKGLNLSQLIKFYKKFGFEVIKKGRKNAVMIKQLK